ncbi:TPA: carbonic anhydrase family protein [Photobacterium damselae]
MDLSKRKLLKYSGGIAALSIVGSTPSITYAASLSKEERDNMSPNDVVNSLIDGNKRFLSNKPLNHDYRAQKKSSQHGQYPSAVILSCIDSRAPAEIILDTGIGELFNSRVAGNISNDDILGSMEFACAAAGAKVVFVMGHTKCGAVKGAIANVVFFIAGLLDKIKPAIKKTTFTGNRTVENYDFVDAVATTNVQLVISDIRKNSATLKKLEDEGKIKIVGAMYDISNGKVYLI